MLYFEDFKAGDVHDLGLVSLTEQEIIDFGTQWDPQPFHVDREAAAASVYGGLIASGWQTASMFMRRYVDGLLSESSCAGSPGVDEIRYHQPVRAGDKLRAKVYILGSRRSFSCPDTGVVQPRCQLETEDGTVVFSMILHSTFVRRSSRTFGRSLDPCHP
ncbi:dehydratase [Kitasatospora sp. MMS16-BH015]|uniref:MaoC family dehydratase n=1 Tax=Kitasatospora sp. MMS16-BH015 TaxID=2018025 RepID=UPI000CA124DE|nr:MaoC family dehydratase [Kitasatospora sp. MMS16-BH015]AUG80683.1 dehydratase [Kitasatospora sp. MMS16-BH015]